MNGNIYIYAGWLKENPLIGIVHSAEQRGKEVISFEYADSWILQHSSLLLDPDIQPYRGRQYLPEEKEMYGFLEDISPDRWGRTLIRRREMIDARKEKRPRKTLFPTDYILGVHDKGRTGAIRVKTDPQGNFLADTDSLEAPPMTEIRKLEQASLGFEAESDPYEEKWFRQILSPGSSLGGARPKANVRAVDGSIWIAKFPSRHDEVNAGAWEMVVHDLAVLSGLHVPEAQLHTFSKFGSTFLVKRFDREKDQRIHFASAMTMLGKKDGDTASYVDIAEFLEKYSPEPEQDVQELWKRIVFSIAVSNTDDHLRNHGFLLQDNKWRLSPAYDLNPSPWGDALSLLIDDQSNEKDMHLAIEAAPYFRMPELQAKEQADRISGIVHDHWRTIAAEYHISNAECEKMKSAFC